MCVPILLVILGKQYYYIDDNGYNHNVDITYDYMVIFGLFTLSFISTYIALGWIKPTQEFKEMISKPDAKMLNYSDYGLNYILNINLKDIISDVMVGITCAVTDFICQYAFSYSMQITVSRSINWTSLLLSFFIKLIVAASTSFTITKLKTTFLFDKESKHVLMGIFVVIAAMNTCAIYGFENSVIFLFDTSSMRCTSNSFSSGSYIVTIIVLSLERLVTFLIFNVYSIPSELSWSNFNKLTMKNKQSHELFLNETIKTKVYHYHLYHHYLYYQCHYIYSNFLKKIILLIVC